MSVITGADESELSVRGIKHSPPWHASQASHWRSPAVLSRALFTSRSRRDDANIRFQSRNHFCAWRYGRTADSFDRTDLAY